MLEALLLLFGMLAAAAIGGKESKSKDEETYENHERIRVYPSERRATRYYNGKREDYYY